MDTAARPAQPDGTIDARVNIAQLLKQPVGGTRRYHLHLPGLALGEERAARDIDGAVKLTRIGDGVLVTGQASATVELTCVRCLEEYTQPLALTLEEEFRPSIDVTSGLATAHRRPGSGAGGDYFLIGDDHVLDLTEALRQAAWLAAPMMPRCREDCPGIPVAGDAAAPESAATADADTGDTRFAILGHLLDRPAAEPAPEPAERHRQVRRPSSS